MLDLLAAKELTEKGVIKLRWCPTHVQLADHLTKQMTSEFLNRYLETGQLSLTQTPEQQAQEQHLAKLRKEQRQRRKTKMKAAKAADTNVLYVLRRPPDVSRFSTSFFFYSDVKASQISCMTTAFTYDYLPLLKLSRIYALP